MRCSPKRRCQIPCSRFCLLEADNVFRKHGLAAAIVKMEFRLFGHTIKITAQWRITLRFEATLLDSIRAAKMM